MSSFGKALPWNTALFLGAILFVQGCAPPVPRPPAFNLYQYDRVAVLPFVNDTRDPAMAADVEDQLSGRLANLDAVPVVQAAQVAKYLESIGADPTMIVLDDNIRAKVASRFKVDLLMTGVITSYEETRKEGEPERRVVNSQTGKAEWGINTFRRADLSVTAKLYDPATGSLLWTEKSSGWSYTNEWTELPIPGSLRIPPIAGLDELLRTAKVARDLVKEREEKAKPRPRGEKPLLYLKSGKFKQLREDSIYQAVNYLMGDFYGSGGWKPASVR